MYKPVTSFKGKIKMFLLFESLPLVNGKMKACKKFPSLKLFFVRLINEANQSDLLS